MLIQANGYIKLTDFGASKPISETNKNKNYVGTLDYIPPEIFSEVLQMGESRIKESNGEKFAYSKSVDWWALGV